MRVTVQKLDDQIVTGRGRVAYFLARAAQYLPLGSTAARLAGFTGMAEELLISQGSLWAAAKGFLVGWLTASGGESLGAWSDSAEPGTFVAEWIQPVVAGLNNAMGHVSTGLIGSPSLAGGVGVVYGAVLGGFGETGATGRIGKIVGSGVEHGLRRIISTWAAQRVAETSNEGRRDRRNTVPRAMASWTKEQTINVGLGGQKLPPGKYVEEENDYCRSILPEGTVRQLDYCQEDATKGLRRIHELAGMTYDTSRAHHAFVSSRNAAYNPIFKVLVRPSLDLHGESLIRVNYELLLEGVSNPELRLALLRARIRAELSGGRLFSDGEVLRVTSGYRTKIIEPSSAARDERKQSHDRNVASSFDRAVNDFLAHLAADLKIKPEPDRSNTLSLRLQNVYRVIPEERRSEFLRALLVGKREMSLEPLCSFFAHGAPPAPGTPEDAELRTQILTLSDALLTPVAG